MSMPNRAVPDSATMPMTAVHLAQHEKFLAPAVAAKVGIRQGALAVGRQVSVFVSKESHGVCQSRQP
jgi:hypothetical protein